MTSASGDSTLQVLGRLDTERKNLATKLGGEVKLERSVFKIGYNLKVQSKTAQGHFNVESEKSFDEAESNASENITLKNYSPQYSAEQYFSLTKVQQKKVTEGKRPPAGYDSQRSSLDSIRRL